jgi:hypothetical protein
MSPKVLHFDPSGGVSELEKVLDQRPEIEFVHVDHSKTGHAGENMIELSRRDRAIRSQLLYLANRGFLAYTLRGFVTSFVRQDQIAKLWIPVRDGVYDIDENGIVYHYSPPLIETEAPKLLVVFSSIAGKMYNVSLMRHFEQNFSTIQKHIPKDTGVLRIADLGGVVGAYYMNTNVLANNEANICALIARVCLKHRVSRSNVVMYGGSKGGTASLYYGLKEGYKVVAVDPIVDDEHYLKVHDDLHFIRGIFPEEKRHKFQRLVGSVEKDKARDVAVICSERSPQFPYISSLVCEPLSQCATFLNSVNPDIKTHPDVARLTINMVVMLINQLLYGFPLPTGMRKVI